MVMKVCLLRQVYPDIGLNIQRNYGDSIFPNSVPYPKIQRTTSYFTNSMNDFFMVTAIDKVTRVLGLNTIECTVAGPLSANPFFLLFITGSFTLATQAFFSPNGRSG